MARSLPMGAARVATRLAFVGFSLCVLGLSASAAGSGADSKRLRLHAPTHLRITSAKQTSLRLSWKASRDKARVAGYYVYRGGRRVASVKRTVTSYTFRGLRCGTGFVLGVSARGAGGSVSTRPSVRGRTAACPVPRDTQAPTAPSELTVTASSRSTLTVAWKAATDNVGVTGYQVYVGGARIATVAATAYTLTGLSCGVSYDVALEAVDSAGNASSRATLQDTTDGCPPPAPSGGTLRVDLNTDVDFTDPSLAYSSTAFQLEYATGLKLYNYPDRPAPEGSMLVHEAAVGFPLITDGGKTYTITLKPDLKFSDGTPVTAANFAYAINRALQPRMASPAVAFIREIVGALDVADDKAAAASGVQAQGDKLIIKLVQPAGDFLTRLSMPWFQAIKTDMPIDPAGVSVYPSAGPYYVAGRVSNSSLTLRRNPYYAGSRPANADTIQYTIGVSLDLTEQRVITGQTDLGDFPAPAAANLAATYGVNAPDGQFHVSPLNIDWYVALNTSRAPFNNVNLRKAFNYAVDRPALVAAMGPYAGSATDQILPPGIPGFRDADVYPLNGPDYPKAQALAGGSCGTVKLWSFNSGLGPAWANVVKSNLEQIGCTVQVTLMNRITEWAMAGVKGADFDAMINGWGPDYPDGDLDVEITRDYAPWVSVANTNARIFNSARLRNYVYQPSYGADLSAFVIR